MKKSYLMIAVTAMSVAVVLTSCGGKKQVASTPEQKAAMGTGNVKKPKDECQTLAFERNITSWRAWGEGVSAKESFATNIAELDARTKIAWQLETQINGLIRSFNQQHSTDSALDESGKATELQEGYVGKLLTNTRVICSNVYITTDGKNQVYVCIELDEKAVTAIVKKVSDDKKLEIDFAEHQFLEEMKKAKEDFRQSQQ
jgi:hypothetical protein